MESHIHGIDLVSTELDADADGVTFALQKNLRKGCVLLEDLISILVREERVRLLRQPVQNLFILQPSLSRYLPVGLHNLAFLHMPKPGVEQAFTHFNFHSKTPIFLKPSSISPCSRYCLLTRSLFQSLRT